MSSLARWKEALKRDRTVKEWTDILVPWLQLLGLVIAGVYALLEYRVHLKEQKKEESIRYITRLNSEELRDINSKLSEQYQKQYIRFNVKHPQSVTPYYYNFIMDDVLMYGQEKSLGPNVNILIGFLDDGVTCSQSKICDERIIKSTLGDFGRTTIETYYPYLCFWNDLFYGDQIKNDMYLNRILHFYKATPLAEGCAPFAADIKKTNALLGS